MKMKVVRFIVAIMLVSSFLVMPVEVEARGKNDVLFQVSTIDALLVGVYDGDMTFSQLKKKGNFGIGTFDKLDGEMICLDGKFYKIRVDGKVYKVKGKEKTPFAVVTNFKSDKKQGLVGTKTLEQLEAQIDSLLGSKNIFYAVKVKGTFKNVKARSVPEQEKPYPLLVDVVKDQAVFEYEDIKGTIVGFWSPAYVKGINVPGYHLHFLSKDRSKGGHLLDCKIEAGTIEIDETSNFYMVLPENEGFRMADLVGDKAVQLDTVEK